MNPRVFIVHETLDKDSGRTKNLKPAHKFGEVIHLVQAGQQPDDLTAVLPRMKEHLRDFNENDFIIPIGHPILIGWATAIAAARTGGKVTLLYWRDRDYHPMSAQLY